MSSKLFYNRDFAYFRFNLYYSSYDISDSISQHVSSLHERKLQERTTRPFPVNSHAATRGKTVPISGSNLLSSKHDTCYSAQHQKLDQYLAWREEQSEKRKRLERCLKSQQIDDPNPEKRSIDEYQGD